MNLLQSQARHIAKAFMSSRKPLYVICVVLLAVLAVLPLVELGLRMGLFTANGRYQLQFRIPGIGETIEFGNQLTWSTFWQDQFFEAVPTDKWDFVGVDPETGAESKLPFHWKDRQPAFPRRYGKRLFLAPISFVKISAAEVIDGRLEPTEFFKHNDRSDNELFLLDGAPAEIELNFRGGFSQRFTLRYFSKGAWNESLALDVPSPDQSVRLGSHQFRFADARDLKILQHNDQTHVFLYFKGFVLHRNGLKTKPIDAPFTEVPSTNVAGTNEPSGGSPANETHDPLDGWSLAGESAHSQSDSPRLLHGAMLIGGQPAFIIVDQISKGLTTGSIFRWDGEKWSLFATQEFPFGALQFRTDATEDGQTSYVVATTSMGVGHVYAVDNNGIRPTKGASSHETMFYRGFSGLPQVFAVALIIEAVLFSIIGFLMWLYTRPDYQFGTQSVRLAPLGRRGVARLIDLSLIVGSALILGWMLTANFQWMTWLEAINLKVDHPIINELRHVILVIVVWMALAALVNIYVQGRWSITPGKWLCGIRVVRSTLRPCGFARSLAREVVLSVDSGNLLCWTPGVVSIAFTNARQRLGDLVADTIVIGFRTGTGTDD